jgi:glutaminyl-peptide cyclotransferase
MAVLAQLALAPGAAPDSPQISTGNWSGDRALADIAAQLRFTPRSLDTPGHEQTIEFIKGELAKTSAKAIRTQRWTYTGSDKTRHVLTNIIASFNPSNSRRIIAGTHYDSIVRAYKDPETPEAAMPGANNSASGVAVLLETARVLSTLPDPPVGVDFVFFDGEEGPKSLGAGDREWIALGSPYFVSHIAEVYPDRMPEKGVIFDMVCYKDLKLKPDLSSLQYALPEVIKFWNIGHSTAPSVFQQESTAFPIGDDHTALSNAGIPSFLVIDFEYEPWFNTSRDTIDKCSAASLEAVGRTLLRYLYIP